MTWTDLLIDGGWPADVVEWRRTHTFGGYVWPCDIPVVSDRWRAGEEDLDEVQWFLDGHVHPLLIAQTLGRSAAAIYRTAKRHDRAPVVAAFAAYSTTKATTRRADTGRKTA